MNMLHMRILLLILSTALLYDCTSNSETAQNEEAIAENSIQEETYADVATPAEKNSAEEGSLNEETPVEEESASPVETDTKTTTKAETNEDNKSSKRTEPVKGEESKVTKKEEAPPTTEAKPSDAPLSHTAWDALLKKYVTASGKVNYQGLKAEKATLETYLKNLSAAAPTGSVAEIKAFWINAYNAFTVKLILDNYPVSSIKNIQGGKPWDYKFITIGGSSYSLNDIEHNVLRKKYFDPRLHFVLVCAAKSCPKLLNKAYTAANLESEMAKQATYFINNTSKNKLAPNQAQVSQLFNWYKGDFTKNGSVQAYLNQYATQKIAADAQITYMDYDWSLNN